VEAAKATMGGLERVADIAGSGVTEGASRVGLPTEVAAGLGVAANIGAGAVVAGGGGKLATSAAPILQNASRILMQSAVKPNLKARTSGAAPKAIETMLDRGIPATAGGLEATQAKVTALEGRINSILEESTATVDKFEIAKNLKSVVEDTKLKLNRASNFEEIRKAYSDFSNHDAIKNLGDKIPVHLANKMKQAFYKELSEKAYQPGAQLGSYDKAEKALAKGIRGEVAKAEPSVVPTLEEQSELINVIKVLAPRVAVEGNKNILGLGVLSPTAEKMVVFMLDRYPWFKSWLAYTMNKGAERIPQAAAGIGIASGQAAAQR